jgi:hypothetical protein
MEGIGTKVLAEEYGHTMVSLENHRSSGHASRELTRQVLGAVATGGPLSEFAQVAIAQKTHRIRALDELARKIETVIRERGAKYGHLPGGETGLISIRQRMIGSGENATIIDEPFFDKDVISEYRSCLEQAAKEAGEWKPDNGQKAEAMAKLAQSIVIHSAVLAHDSCESRELEERTKNDSQVIDITVDAPSE